MSPVVDELECAEREERLADGVEVDERVQLPKGSALSTSAHPPARSTTVHPVDDHADRGTHLVALGEVAGELLFDQGESGVTGPDDRHVHDPTLAYRGVVTSPASDGRLPTRRSALNAEPLELRRVCDDG